MKDPPLGLQKIFTTLTTQESLLPSQRELDQFFAELEKKLISVQRASELSDLAAGHVRYLLQQRQSFSPISYGYKSVRQPSKSAQMASSLPNTGKLYYLAANAG